MANICYYGDLRQFTGKTEDVIGAADLPALLTTIGRLYGPKAKKAAKTSLIVVDTEKVLSIGKTKLKADSQVGFFPMCGGG